MYISPFRCLINNSSFRTKEKCDNKVCRGAMGFRRFLGRKWTLGSVVKVPFSLSDVALKIGQKLPSKCDIFRSPTYDVDRTLPTKLSSYRYCSYKRGDDPTVCLYVMAIYQHVSSLQGISTALDIVKGVCARRRGPSRPRCDFSNFPGRGKPLMNQILARAPFLVSSSVKCNTSVTLLLCTSESQRLVFR